ncbi:adenosine deaminase 2-like [Diorhabda carinulata]|uniref:adenosine deaminase 2-like n=1 Tax=Diorhabda carinulata TaxID=1163345 RepID=UPI0025A188B0|nr:adenosine deaminase 2-like [Diorhabda carinulata]
MIVDIPVPVFRIGSIIVIFVQLTVSYTMSSESYNYTEERNKILQEERMKFIGNDLILTDNEMKANEIILKVKKTELNEGYDNESTFLASQHFFKAKNKIERSEMFNIIKKIPKGGSLHTHYLSGVSADFIINNITHRKNIYGCDLNGVFKLRFFEDATNDTTCNWKKLEDYRKENSNFDDWLRKQLILDVENPYKEYPTADSVWAKFKKIFSTQYDMVCYKPVFELFIYQLLNELYSDNVIYTELRGTFMPLYELNGKIYNSKEFMKIFINTVERFKKNFPDFVGVRYIHSVYRGLTIENLTLQLDELTELKKLFPNFVAGFDLIGREEEGHCLFEIHQLLSKYSENLKFYFHAGETNWFGHTDLNIIDAVLLNSSRIGHGFGLNKHPVVTRLAKDKNICVELCPISNQVLMLISDPRNHPMIGLMAEGFPVVICNDDPSAWETIGLSYDWYVAFMAMTSENDGIRVLKQFALNSILYSAMEDEEKEVAVRIWEKSWQEFIDYIILHHK